MPDYVHRYAVTLTGSSLFRDEADKIMADFAARCAAGAIAADISPTYEEGLNRAD